MHDLGDMWALCRALNEHCSDLAGSRVLGQMYCPGCGGSRRMSVRVDYASGTLGAWMVPYYGPGPRTFKDFYPQELTPSLFGYQCTQCDTRFTALVYEGQPGEPHLAIFPTKPGGLCTPHTPRAVAYYLDQAQRARSVTAFSAAVCMYRAALEQLLHDKGFTQGMLEAKIKALEAQMATGSAPWARDLDTEYLRVMKELGNGAVHTNGGDISRQTTFDAAILSSVERTFLGLLEIAYEEPIRRAANLSALRAAAAAVKK